MEKQGFQLICNFHSRVPKSRRNRQDADTKTSSIVFQDLGLKIIA